jgi:hypothetical protein
MKSRRKHRPRVVRWIEEAAYWGEVIPPRSVVKVEACWGADQGRVFRIGYYSRTDGLNCVWLVNEAGIYEQATTQNSIRDDFYVLFRSDETDHYGTNRAVLQPTSTEALLSTIESA